MYKGKRYPSLIHPMGVLKEQTSQLYATKLATRSFVALSFKINPCIKAITTVSMYDMGDAIRHGVRHSVSKAEREAFLKEVAIEHYKQFSTHKITRYAVGAPTKIDTHSSPIAKEFYGFYRTKRGAYTTQGQDPKPTSHQFSSDVKCINFYPF